MPEKKIIEEFDERFVFIPPPESHISGGTLLKPYEIKSSVSVGEIKSFILQVRSEAIKEMKQKILKHSARIPKGVLADLLS